MRRRFRQKEDQRPKEDPERDDGLSEDGPGANVDIGEVVKEIDKHLEEQKKPKPKPEKS